MIRASFKILLGAFGTVSLERYEESCPKRLLEDDRTRLTLRKGLATQNRSAGLCHP